MSGTNYQDQEEGRVWRKDVDKRLAACIRGTNTRTINFPNTDTAAEINAKIAANHRYIASGATLYFQLGNGINNLDAPILIDGFYGGGVIQLLGNVADNSLSTVKNVTLNFNNGTNGINIFNNTNGGIRVLYLKIQFDSSADGNGIHIANNNGYTLTRYNYCLGDDDTKTNGVYVANNSGGALVRDTYFSDMKYAVQNFQSVPIVCNNNDDTGTQPAYGLYANKGGIHKPGTQPTGSTANELIVNSWID